MEFEGQKNKAIFFSNRDNNYRLSSLPSDVDKKVLGIIPIEMARQYRMATFRKKGNVVDVAMSNPDDINALNSLQFLAEKENINIKIFSASDEIIRDLLKGYESADKALKDVVSFLEEEKEKTFSEIKSKKTSRLEEEDVIQDAPVSKLGRVIIDYALEGNASDIHIEPDGDKYRVRYRVDGILRPSLFLPRDVGLAVISHIKILANLKIDEKRKPQDGRFKIKKNKLESIDFRVSTFPVMNGEKIALRVLNKEDKIFQLNELGIIGSNREILLKKIKKPYGIILITGPTGSGKSTSLYTFLKIINNVGINIVTLEDPVEYSMDGINQSQIKPEIGYTFANGLRSILRQDPNVIMVGEIRDTETAELAIHAALTGHLVFSTLHTNNALGAVPRLVDMGVEPFLISSSLKCLMAQRLVRRICPHCKREVKIPGAITEKIKEELANVSDEEKEKYGVFEKKGYKIYQGKGCEKCDNTGYMGRIAICEVVDIDDKFKNIISEEKGRELFLKKEAERRNLITMKQDGLLKVLAGITTLEEVMRITEGTLSVGGDIEDDKG